MFVFVEGALTIKGREVAINNPRDQRCEKFKDVPQYTIDVNGLKDARSLFVKRI